MIKCKFCNQYLKSNHAYGPHSKVCIKYKEYINSFSKELLYDLYYNQEYSIQDIANKFNCCHSMIDRIFKKFKIKRRSFKECSSTNNKRQKTIQTNLKKYGYKHNFCKNHPSRKKWEKRLLKEEGITNVFQRLEVKKKSLETFINKYKTEKWKHSFTSRGRGVISKINKEIFDILKKNNVVFEIEFKIKNPKALYYSYDILLENKKIIEIYGDYWHGNPRIYNSEDIILKGSSKEYLVKEKWEKDRIKNNFAKKRKYQILIIWEYDLKNNRQKTIRKILNYAKN